MTFKLLSCKQILKTLGRWHFFFFYIYYGSVFVSLFIVDFPLEGLLDWYQNKPFVQLIFIHLHLLRKSKRLFHAQPVIDHDNTKNAA